MLHRGVHVCVCVCVYVCVCLIVVIDKLLVSRSWFEQRHVGFCRSHSIPCLNSYSFNMCVALKLLYFYYTLAKTFQSLVLLGDQVGNAIVPFLLRVVRRVDERL